MIEDLAVIVPTFNRKEVTLECIRQINSQDCKLNIYVCDSGSSDGTVEVVHHEPNVVVIDAGPHAWWSAAVNRGIEVAISNGYTAILILNDDIEFDGKLIPDLLKKHREHPRAIISPLQQSPTGPFLGMRYVGWTKKMELLRDAASDTLVDTTNGCCLLVPTAVFASVGLIDEVNCPHQYGDTEFQLRARRLGFPTVACPSIKIAQLGATDYYSRLKLGVILNFAGSPMHFRAYFQFGKTLFGGAGSFMLWGMKYHYGYLKTLVKALMHIANRK